MWLQGYSRLTYPLTILPTLEGNLKNKKKVFDRADKRIIAHFYAGKMDAYFSQEDEDYYHATVLRKISQDANFMKRVEREVKSVVKNLLQFSREINQCNLEKFSDNKLVLLLNKFHKLYAEIFAFGLVNTYDRDLVWEVKNYFLKNWPKNRAIHFFTVLTSVTQDTYYQKEEKDLLKVASLLKKNKSTKIVNKILNRLVANYGWLYINYEGRPRKKADFKKQIQQVLRRTKDSQKRLQELEKKTKILKQEQMKLEGQFKIDPFYLRLIKAIRKNAYLREYRKPLAIKAIFHERKLIDEIARRLKISQKELKFLLPQEIQKALQIKKVNRVMLKRRMIESVYDFKRTNYKVLMGKKAKKLLKEIRSQSEQGIKEIRGISACPGKVRGKVRLVFDLSELAKFKKREIFVGKATSPEMVPVFKKAKAVVTNEGGLTSHAAIVSREMKVPCVVGTNRATRLLKTGDKVEVDADSGVVRILKVK